MVSLRSWNARAEDERVVFAQLWLAQHRLGRLVTEADRRPEMTPTAVVAADHAARDQIWMRYSFGQSVNASETDVERCEKSLPFRKRSLAEFAREEPHHRPLMWARSAQA